MKGDIIFDDKLNEHNLHAHFAEYSSTIILQKSTNEDTFHMDIRGREIKTGDDSSKLGNTNLKRFTTQQKRKI